MNIEAEVLASFNKIVNGRVEVTVDSSLKELGLSSCALGFTADFTGIQLTEMLKMQGIKTDFIHVCRRRNGMCDGCIAFPLQHGMPHPAA